TVMEEVSQPNIDLMNDDGLNKDNNMDEALVHETTSNVNDLDVLTRKIKAGDYDELKERMTSDEWKVAMRAIEAKWKKIVADVTSTTKVSTNNGVKPKEEKSFRVHHHPIEPHFQKPSDENSPYHGDAPAALTYETSFVIETDLTISVSSLGLVSLLVDTLVELIVEPHFQKPSDENSPYHGDAPAALTYETSFVIETDLTISVSSLGLVSLLVDTLVVFSEDGISLIASQIADEPLQDIVSMGIPLPKGEGFIKETVRVEYEWKLPRCEQYKIFGHMDDQYPKKAATTPNVVNND
nr:zinc knuckle CX2CX4HX4C [Tanacetum cinerariifolium]